MKYCNRLIGIKDFFKPTYRCDLCGIKEYDREKVKSYKCPIVRAIYYYHEDCLEKVWSDPVKYDALQTTAVFIKAGAKHLQDIENRSQKYASQKQVLKGKLPRSKLTGL